MTKLITRVKQLFFIALVAAFLPTQTTQAQDVHFSQFYASPLTLNPALTGLFPGHCRFVANYRDQWWTWVSHTFYTTYSASFEIKALASKDYFQRSGDVLAFGGVLVTDRTAQNQSHFGLSHLKAMGSMGYHKKLSDNDYLGIGFQAGYVQKGTIGDPILPSYYDNECKYYPDRCRGNTQMGWEPTQSFGYMDLQGGLIYYRFFDNGILNSIFAGGSAFHILEPKESFGMNNEWKIHRRYIGHAGATVEVGSNWYVLPNFIWMQQGTTKEILAGAYLMKTDFLPNVDIYGGVWSRLVDAVYPMIGFQSGPWRFGANYDITYSKAVPANRYKGAIELSMQYLCSWTRIKVKDNPCPRM